MKLGNVFWTVLLVIACLANAGCGPSAPPEGKIEEAETKAETPAAEEPAEDESAGMKTPEVQPEEEAKPVEKPEPPKPKAVKGPPVVVIETTKGTIKVELDPERAPITVKNFLQYVDNKFYDGTIFHRVKPNFMIQGGGFTPDMQEKKTRSPIKNEAANGLANLRGTIAMARTPDPDSATSQFFINHRANSFLNKSNPRSDGVGYAVFGKVIEGMDVVDEIAAVKTGNRAGHADVPLEPIVIKSARRAG